MPVGPTILRALGAPRVATRLLPLAPRVTSQESREAKSQQGLFQWAPATSSKGECALDLA
jgi:hypothetical protein